MGVYSHATHVYLPEKETGKVIAGAMLKSAQPLVLCKPYGKWINVYLELGLSYKDVLEFPTAAYIEMNCYNSEGLDVRLYAQDRLVYKFESGCGDVTEEEDVLVEIAADLWAKDNPELAAAARAEAAKPANSEEEVARKSPDFWHLAPGEQEKFIARARESSKYKQFLSTSQAEDTLPDVKVFGPYLPEGRAIDDLHLLFLAISHRLHGAPEDERQKAVLEKWMGSAHSPNAEDYLRAVQDFLGLKGSLWSLDSIHTDLADKIDRRIVATDAIETAPKGK